MEEEKKKTDFKYNFKTFWSLLRKYKWQFFALLFIILIVEALAIADKFLFKILVDKGAEFEKGTLLSSGFTDILIILAGVFILALIIKSLLKWIELQFINNLDSNLVLDLKKRFFNHIISLSYGFHVSNKTGSLISRLSRGSRAVERMADTIIFSFCPLIFQFIVAAGSIILFDTISTIIIFITIILFIIFNFVMQQIQQDSNLRANEVEDIEKANIGDMFTNVDSIKYFGKDQFIKNKFLKLITNTKDAFIKNWGYFRWLDAGNTFILGLGTFFLIYFSVIKFLNGQMTLGTLVFIYTVYLGLIGPLFSFTYGMRDLYKVMADFESLFQYSKIGQEVKDKSDAKIVKINDGEIEFKNVSFDYGKRKIFENFSLKIPKNMKVALVGHSGSGKSTLVKLLYRFYDINHGKILIDGKDIRDFKQEFLRQEMAIVPQECVLFDDTIYNNIAFSNQKASREEIMAAIKFAQLDKLINNFPLKENTIVGERGVKLSGGEKQRVSIARAILADKKILVLDEATSSLDSETEHEIQKDLERLMQGRTTIMIAHRLSTIMNADKIVVMKNGKIVQAGKHNQLIQQPGEYRKLWSLQKRGYIK
ncbi:MAG: ABC transporter ATP-binding protein [Nanoarchaeota archaeon]|nr:ABC transporter ATP-binding protein [Nanoarchaeota archaeon]